MISFITYEIAPNQVCRCMRKCDQGRELLLEPLGNRLQAKYTFSQYDSSCIDRHNTIHVSRNIKLLKCLDTCFISILHILLRFFELFKKFHARMSKNNSFEVYELALFKFYVYDWSTVANEDNLSVFVSLLYRNSWLGDYFFAGIYSFCKSDNTVLFGKI